MGATEAHSLIADGACYGVGTPFEIARIALLSRILDAVSSSEMSGPLQIGTPTQMIVFGDSIACGWDGGDFVVPSQVDKISSDLGIAITNHASGGQTLPWSCDPLQRDMFGEQCQDGTLYWIGHGFGENAFMTTDTQINSCFYDELLGCAAWLSIKHSKKTLGNGTTAPGVSMVKSGVWLSVPYLAIGCSSFTNGSTITISGLVGRHFILGFTGYDPNHTTNSATFTIHLDGVLKNTLNSEWDATFDIPLGATPSWEKIPRGIVVSAPSYGTHTIVITVTSPTNALNLVEFNWCATLEAASSISDGACLIAGVTLAAPNEQENPDGRYGGEYFHRIARMNSVQSAVASLLRGFGLRVAFMDAYSAITDTDTDILPDGVHPSEEGYLKIAALAETKFTVL